MRQMTADLLTVASIPMETIRQLSQSLEQQTGFMTDDSLAGLVAQVVEEESQGTAVFNTLQNLSAGSVEQVLEAVQQWREADEGNQQRFPEESFRTLQQTLPILIRDYPALRRMKKAARLRNVLGNEMQGVLFVCDARPVYNNARTEIEGLISLTTMKVVYERQNMETEEIEITLTGEQLEELVAKATQAKDKMAVLRESITRWLPNGCVDQGDEDGDET